MSIGPRAEKFYIVSNDGPCTKKYDFYVLYRKYSLWANIKTKKLKSLVEAGIWYLN